MLPSYSPQGLGVTPGERIPTGPPPARLAPEALTRCERTVTFGGLLLSAEPISRYFDDIVE